MRKYLGSNVSYLALLFLLIHFQDNRHLHLGLNAFGFKSYGRYSNIKNNRISSARGNFNENSDLLE
jgi:hypothetical protein